MQRKPLVLLGIAGLAFGFYLFRPDTLLWTQRVDESFPAASGATDESVLLSGRFHGVAHETSGTATVHRLADGRRVLRLTGFTTSNGPDVRVRLARAADPPDNASVTKGGSVEVAPLKGNVGDQNYDLPGDLDLSAYHSVVIWCNRFGVNFGAAPLAPAEMGGRATVLASGRFHSVAHETSGTATIHRLADGRRVLRLTDFKTSNGPDVRVRLGKAADPRDNDTVKSAGSVEVAPLKGTEGDQNYVLPADLDLAAFHSVVIWCNRFGVNFGTAPLTAN